MFCVQYNSGTFFFLVYFNKFDSSLVQMYTLIYVFNKCILYAPCTKQLMNFLFSGLIYELSFVWFSLVSWTSLVSKCIPLYGLCSVYKTIHEDSFSGYI